MADDGGAARHDGGGPRYGRGTPPIERSAQGVQGRALGVQVRDRDDPKRVSPEIGPGALLGIGAPGALPDRRFSANTDIHPRAIRQHHKAIR